MKNFTLLFLFSCVAAYSQCYSEISSKVYHNLSIRADGTLWAWGSNTDRQVGNGSTVNQSIPVQIGTANNWKSVHAGSFFSLAIKNDGTLWSWGSNTYGQTGNGPSNGIPRQIGTDTNWVTAASGLAFGAAIKSDGSLWMWGFNDYGQLGNGTVITTSSPNQVGIDTDWVAVSLGVQHTIALKSNGTLWAWGWNSNGQLGTGGGNKHVPTQVGTDIDWAKITAGYTSSFAIKSNGTLWAWGADNYGQQGNGTSGSSSLPVQRTGTWKSISATHHCLAIKTDGTLWSWGRNTYGEVGSGTPGVYVQSPVQVGTATDWVQAATGWEHSIALKENGSLYSWGGNEFGTLGNGTFVNNNAITLQGTDCNSLANNSIEGADFILYPSPAEGILHIANTHNYEIRRFVIYDVGGRAVLSSSGNVSSVNISSLNIGSYYINIENDLGIFTKWFVKK